MTAVEYLREKAALLRHAVTYDQSLTAEGTVTPEIEHHALTCVRCGIEREADELETKEKET